MKPTHDRKIYGRDGLRDHKSNCGEISGVEAASDELGGRRHSLT